MKNLFLRVFTLTLLFGIPGFNREIFNSCLTGLGAQEAKAASILNHYATRNFIAGAVNRTDLETILQAGVRAPSANNRQPWQFTVVQNQDLAKQIVSNIVDGNVLIIISGPDGQNDGRVILDCALATESIYLAAQALGYGSRIYTGPMNAINRSLKTALSLPTDYSAVALVRVGRVQSGVDAVSAASGRKNLNAVVNYK
ncbi:MAG: nitroreductase family protein [Spirochaetaceae bacterium]|jgi:nitroreductase|nr:nitroreductase family protein [Spirochaetaceae bacterium]